jgi:catechol 2,3-dioxygenase-like lactoylglutathione lyase family enzyme
MNFSGFVARLGLAVAVLVSGTGAQMKARPAITGIAFVRLYAADRDASAAFYDHDLGFVRVNQGAFDRYAVSDSQWFEVAPLPAPAPAARLAAVAFTTRNAAGLERYLRAHSVAIEQPLEHGEFAVKDPEGNLVIFVQAGSQKVPPSAFSTRKSSGRIIHTGFAVHSEQAEDRFYREILEFKPNWRGGRDPAKTDWVSLQVPEGSDWLEYMLNGGPNPNAKQLGVMDHFSLGTAQMSSVVDALARNGCTSANCKKTQMGLDGKVQLNVFDPDLTRVEYMEFKPSGTICCSPILGKMPSEVEEK